MNYPAFFKIFSKFFVRSRYVVAFAEPRRLSYMKELRKMNATMPSVCLYLHVHQPFRIKRTSLFDIGANPNYFDDEANRRYLARIAAKSYIPTNKILLNLIKETGGKFKVSMSITGTLLEQLQANAPEVVKSFQDLVDTGCVDLVSETYFHSLAYFYSKEEFAAQVRMQQDILQSVFGVTPRVFRNTELIYNNEIAETVGSLGFDGMLMEGADHILGWRSPNFVYSSKTSHRMPILLRDYKMSDDIAFRFSNKGWSEWPLTAEKFTHWVNQKNGSAEIINLFMDYETLGEHQWEDTGIFEFLKTFPHRILEHPDNRFVTVSEAVAQHKPVAELDVHNTVTWADLERDLSAWLGNDMQKRAIEHLYSFENAVRATGDKALLHAWRKLQTSDHFYYMCTKWFSDGDVHKYFNPHESPYECFISFMNILHDLEFRLKKLEQKEAKSSSQPPQTPTRAPLPRKRVGLQTKSIARPRNRKTLEKSPMRRPIARVTRKTAHR